MKRNLNTEYEIFTKEIYEEILKEEGFENIEVLHNQKVKGKSGLEHQIDVYWSFRLGGIEHKVAIECKNYSERVSKDKIQSFKTIVDDLSAKGIFVARSGYQSGAKEFAKFLGIELKEVRQPLLGDWNGLVREININMNCLFIEVKNITPIFDMEWMKKNYFERKSFQIDRQDNEVVIKKESGEIIESFYDLKNKLPRKKENTYGLTYEYKYEDGYIDDNDGNLLKLKKVIYTYDSLVAKDNMNFNYEHLVKGIIKDVESEEVKFIKK